MAVVFGDTLVTKISDGKVTPIKNAIISATIRGADLADNILLSRLNGLQARGRNFVKYGKDKYYGGLPVSTVGVYSFGGRYLNEPITENPFPGDYFPMVPIMENQEFLTEELHPFKYKYTRRLLKRSAMKLNDLIGAMEDAERKDENGDIIPGNPVDGIDDVFFVFGADIYSQDPNTATYLFDMFFDVKDLMYNREADYQLDLSLWTLPEASDMRNNYIFIEINESNVALPSQYVVSIYSNWIEYEELVGEVLRPKPGNPDKIINDSEIVIEEGTSTRVFNGGNGPDWFDDTSITTIRKQIEKKTDSNPGLYGEFRIGGLRHSSEINVLDTFITILRTIPMWPSNSAGDNPNSGTYTAFADLPLVDPEYGRSGLYFPINKDILEYQLGSREEIVLAEAISLVMCTGKEIELKWYQQTWFKVVMIIIMAVVTYLTVGAALKEGVALITALSDIAIQGAIAFLIEKFAVSVGGDIGAVIAAAAAIYAIYRADFSAADKLIPGAADLLKVTQGITSGVKIKVSRDLSFLEEDKEDFLKTVEERQEELQAAYELLGDPTQKIDPLTLVGAAVGEQFNLSPETFYSLATKSNMASTVYEAFNAYYDNMLTLPKVGEVETQFEV